MVCPPSSAWRKATPVKKADALRRISFAVFSSLFSLCNSINCSRSAELKDSGFAFVTFRFLTHECRVAGEQPIFTAINSMADHYELCLDCCSKPMRMARSRITGVKVFWIRFFMVIAPFSQRLEPPRNPGLFTLVYISFRSFRFSKLLFFH